MIPYTMYNDNVQLRTEIERLRKERDELVRLCDMTLSMLLKEHDTISALFKAENMLREAIASVKGAK